jgi:hypothetical protein
VTNNSGGQWQSGGMLMLSCYFTAIKGTNVIKTALDLFVYIALKSLE